MKLRYRVTRTGMEPYEVNTNLFVVVAWERKFKTKISAMRDGFGYEDMAYQAYEASKLAGVVVPVTFDDFIRQLEDLEVVDQEQENPTHAEQSAEHSQNF
jgi:hypothetical protein